MDEILLANFMVFHDLVEQEQYDLWIGDEAWDVDYYLHENPELKRAPYAWLTDFVGYLPMPAGGDREAFLTADYNAEMIERIARFPYVRDRAIFVGDPVDIVADRFGPALPRIRDWTVDHFAFAGYVTGRPGRPAGRAELRAAAGIRRRRDRLRRLGRRIGRRRRPAPAHHRGVPAGRRARRRAAHGRGGGPADRPCLAALLRPVSRCTATSTGSTGTSPPATSRSCRAASRPAWS